MARRVLARERATQPDAAAQLSADWVARGLVLVVMDGMWITPQGARRMSPINTPGRRTGQGNRTMGFGSTDSGGTNARFNGLALRNSQAGPRSYFGTCLPRSTGGGALGRFTQDVTGSGAATVGEEAIYFVSGRLTLSKVDTTAGALQFSPNTTTPLGSWISFGFSCNFPPGAVTSTSDLACYLNGRRDTTFIANNPAGINPTGASANMVFGNRPSDSARTWDGQIGILAVFDARLSDTDQAALHANPWQVLEPQRRSMSWTVPVSTRRLRLIRDAVQADSNATINNAVPFTRGLAFLTAGGSPVDMVRGQVSTLPALNRVGQAGLGLTAGTGNAGARFATPPIVTSDGVGTGDFTMAVMANAESASTRQGLISQDGFGLAQGYIFANADAALSLSPGSVMFGSFFGAMTSVAVAGAINGKMRTFVGVRRGTTMELYADGVLIGSASGTVRQITEPGTGIAVAGTYGYTGLGTPASVPFAAGWNRALTVAEARALSLNPLQMLTRVRFRGAQLDLAIALEIFSALHGHTADNLGLTSDTALTVDAATHAHLADNLGLSTDIALFVDAANHAHVVDNLGLTLQVALVTDAATHAHLADNLTLTPAGATIYRPTSDITVTGWVPTGASTVYETINEAVASDAEYSTSPDLTTPATLGFASMPAGTRIVRVRAARTGSAGQIRIRFLDSGGADVGGTAWQTLTGTPTTYTLTATVTATATRARIEVQA